MDLIALALERSRSSPSQLLRFKGTYPDASHRVSELLRTTGIIKHLNIPGQVLGDRSKYHLFPLRTGRSKPVHAQQSSDHERYSQELAEYFTECLESLGYTLTNDGLRYLCKLVSETLTNAQEHSDFPLWHVIGYMTQEEAGGVCNICIVNFGHTIHQSLRTMSEGEQRRRLEALTRLHSGRRLFGARWNEEALWTLYALQEGVSRYRGEPKTPKDPRAPDRGVGTIEMIRFFERLSSKERDPPSLMCVLSGSSYILFDGTYTLLEGPNEKALVTFNEQGSFDYPPDSRYVRTLRGHFPGTLIAMRFRLDPAHLGRLVRDTTNEDD